MSDDPKTPSASPRPFRVPRLVTNWISLSGVVLAGAAIFAFALLFAIDLFAEHANPYMGILAYIVSPAFFFLGLALVLGGYMVQRRNRKKTRGEAVPLVLSIDLSKKRHRRLLGAFGAGTVGFLFLTAFGSYQSYHETQSVGFCGEACHQPMEPQYATYQHSPHANVECVECHIGPGARAYLKTKVNGMRQLYHAVLGDYNRPIRLHDRDRRPTEETCEGCHWRAKYTGAREKTFRHFLADETNTPFTVRMLINVGGGDPTSGPVGGIHWHMNLANKIEFIAGDEEANTIPWVRATDADGKVTVFKKEDWSGDPAASTIHQMDCMDCHNRPAHKFLTPNDAIDRAMANGRIDPTIPWAKKKAVEALVQPYGDREEAKRKIGDYLRGEYDGDKRAEALVSEVQAIYARNFYPEMKADWRAHPDHISHKNWNGCFRCHDGSHVAEDGETTIKASDCTSCHIILAQGSGEDLLKLDPKGYDFLHVDFEYSDFDCADCHNGANQEDDEEEEDAETDDEGEEEE